MWWKKPGFTGDRDLTFGNYTFQVPPAVPLLPSLSPRLAPLREDEETPCSEKMRSLLARRWQTARDEGVSKSKDPEGSTRLNESGRGEGTDGGNISFCQGALAVVSLSSRSPPPLADPPPLQTAATGSLQTTPLLPGFLADALTKRDKATVSLTKTQVKDRYKKLPDDKKAEVAELVQGARASVKEPPYDLSNVIGGLFDESQIPAADPSISVKALDALRFRWHLATGDPYDKAWEAKKQDGTAHNATLFYGKRKEEAKELMEGMGVAGFHDDGSTMRGSEGQAERVKQVFKLEENELILLRMGLKSMTSEFCSSRNRDALVRMQTTASEVLHLLFKTMAELANELPTAASAGDELRVFMKRQIFFFKYLLGKRLADFRNHFAVTRFAVANPAVHATLKEIDSIIEMGHQAVVLNKNISSGGKIKPYSEMTMRECLKIGEVCRMKPMATQMSAVLDLVVEKLDAFRDNEFVEPQDVTLERTAIAQTIAFLDNRTPSDTAATASGAGGGAKGGLDKEKDTVPIPAESTMSWCRGNRASHQRAAGQGSWFERSTASDSGFSPDFYERAGLSFVAGGQETMAHWAKLPAITEGSESLTMARQDAMNYLNFLHLFRGTVLSVTALSNALYLLECPQDAFGGLFNYPKHRGWRRRVGQPFSHWRVFSSLLLDSLARNFRNKPEAHKLFLSLPDCAGTTLEELKAAIKNPNFLLEVIQPRAPPPAPRDNTFEFQPADLADEGRPSVPGVWSKSVDDEPFYAGGRQ